MTTMVNIVTMTATTSLSFSSLRQTVHQLGNARVVLKRHFPSRSPESFAGRTRTHVIGIRTGQQRISPGHCCRGNRCYAHVVATVVDDASRHVIVDVTWHVDDDWRIALRVQLTAGATSVGDVNRRYEVIAVIVLQKRAEFRAVD